jgi:excisionase family DNA binding protein
LNCLSVLEALAARLVEVAARLQEPHEAQADDDPPNRLLTAAEVAERTGLTKGRVYALARQGEAGAVRVGERGVRFSAAGLEAWLRGGGSS